MGLWSGRTFGECTSMVTTLFLGRDTCEMELDAVCKMAEISEAYRTRGGGQEELFSTNRETLH